MSDGESFPHALSLTCCSPWLSVPYVSACLAEYLHTSGWQQSLRLVSRTLAQLPKAAGPACQSNVLSQCPKGCMELLYDPAFPVLRFPKPSQIKRKGQHVSIVLSCSQV